MVDIDVNLFFDRDIVTRAIAGAAASVLSRQGSYVRTNAQRRIRKRKRSASPGEAPSSHVGLLRKLIFFNYEPENKGVVIGPKILNGSKRTTSQTIPQLLEFGGKAPLENSGKPASWRGNPFMGPALSEESPKFAAMWAGSVK